MTYRLIIAGSRNAQNPNIERIIDAEVKHLSGTFDVEIVTGDSGNVDGTGNKYAIKNGHNLMRFNAKWKDGLRAGPARNREMANYANGLLAFWDRKSRGTMNMIQEAMKRDLKVNVYDLINNCYMGIDEWTELTKK